VLKVTGFGATEASASRAHPAEPRADRNSALPKVPPPALLWTVRLPEGKPVFRLTPADIDGDGRPELLVACGDAGYAVAGDGRLLWTCQTEGAVRDVSMARFDRQSPATVHVSSADTRVYQLDPSGALKRRAEMSGIYFSADHGERPWGVYCTRAVDADSDGVDDMLVTTLASMETQGLGPDLSRRWRTPRTAYHGCMDIAVADVNGDGGPEIVLGNKYGSICILTPDGTPMSTSYTSIGDVWFALGDLNGDGLTEVVHGSSTGDLVAVDLKGKVLWRFDNFGYPVTRIQCADLDGDGRPEVLVASGTGYLYCLAADGVLRWARRLGLAVHDVVVVDRMAVAGTEEGGLHVVDGVGRTLRTWSMGSAVMKLAPMKTEGRPFVIAGLSDGRLAALPMP
jgi:outer membrane protein assembly factor BamB